MKKILILIALFLTGTSSSFSAPYKYWVDEEKKIVQFLPNPLLKMKLDHIGADNDYWDMLTLDFSYVGNPDFNEAMQALTAKYPGYQFSKVVMSGVKEGHLAIPALGIDQNVELKLSVDGPFYRDTIFIPKSKSDLIRSKINESGFVALTGSSSFYVRRTLVLETYDLGAQVCQDLVSSGNSVFAIILQFSKLADKIDSLGLQYPSTVGSLKLAALRNCFDLQLSGVLTTFEELLNSKLKLKPSPLPVIGETKKTAQLENFEPFQTAVLVEVQK